MKTSGTAAASRRINPARAERAGLNTASGSHKTETDVRADCQPGTKRDLFWIKQVSCSNAANIDVASMMNQQAVVVSIDPYTPRTEELVTAPLMNQVARMEEIY